MTTDNNKTFHLTESDVVYIMDALIVSEANYVWRLALREEDHATGEGPVEGEERRVMEHDLEQTKRLIKLFTL